MCAYVDDLRWRHRPLFYYGLTHVLWGLFWTPRVMVNQHGFERRIFRGKDRAGSELRYWYRPPSVPSAGAAGSTGESSADGDREALVFIHGIGVGPVPYMDFVAQAATEEQAVIVVELASVSQRISFDTKAATSETDSQTESDDLGSQRFTSWLSSLIVPEMEGLPPLPKRFAELMDDALEDLGIDRVVVAGHSLGSAYAHYYSMHDREKSLPRSSKAKASQSQEHAMTPSESVDAPQINKRRVGGLVLLDPIACCLYHPRVTSEFVYPQVTGVLQAAEDYFVKKELFAAALISRHLPWHQANVWLEDCSPAVPTLVGLSTDDKIVPSDAVQKVFGSWSARLRHGTRVLRMPGLGHGEWLSDHEHHLPRLAQEVRKLSSEAAMIGKAQRSVDHFVAQ